MKQIKRQQQEREEQLLEQLLKHQIKKCQLMEQPRKRRQERKNSADRNRC